MNNQRFTKRKFIVIISVLFPFSCSVFCFAEESAYKGAVQNSFQSGLAGTVLRVVVTAFNSKFDNYTSCVDISSRGRVSVGSANDSLHRTINRSFASIENGKVSFGISPIIPDYQDRTVRGALLS